MSRLLPGLLLVALAVPGLAQTEVRRAPDVCRLPVTALAQAPAGRQAARPSAPECDPGTEGAVFAVEYTGFPAGAEAAFQAAVDTWACRVRSDQTIRVAASWEPLAASTLGSAGPFLYRNFEGAPTRDVWYPAALADAFAGRDLGGDSPDIEAFFNSEFSDWHLGPGRAPAGLYDLYTVVLHELGHGLGLIGALAVEDGVGRAGEDPRGPFSYDLHTQDARGVPLLDADVYPDGTAVLAGALQGEVRFGGRAVEQVNGRSVPLYSPPRWVQGGSYSHLDEDTYPAGQPDGLMTPFVARGETIPEPGPVVCAMLSDVGWPLAGACAARVGPVPAPDPRVVVERRGRNPFSSRTSVRITSEQAVSIRTALVDGLGRLVVDYGTSILIGGRSVDVGIEAGGLAAGVYFLSVRGGPAPVTVPLVVVR